MARVVLGMGTSHGPMLSVPSEDWHERVRADRVEHHFFNGRRYTFDELVELRKAEDLADQITPDISAARYKRNLDAITTLGDVFRDTGPDIALIVGNDQMEVFSRDHLAAFAVFWGDYVEGNTAFGEGVIPKEGPAPPR